MTERSFCVVLITEWYIPDAINTDVFLKGYDFGEKVDLSKGYWNPKRKMWVTAHFPEIIKQQ